MVLKMQPKGLCFLRLPEFSTEEIILRPQLKRGFKGVDEFLKCAQTVLQRRKSRAGVSLELHIREILLEENFIENKDFSFQAQTERNKKPDFIFPSQEAYFDKDFPKENLKMLAVKTTCKDRWRQILTEADRIQAKHLLTLQEGVSENQFKEMKDANINLVVPKPLIKKYPRSIQPELIEFNSFLADARLASVISNAATR